MHHLATLHVFFAAAILAIVFGIATQATFARAGFGAVKKFADAPFHGFGAAPPATGDEPTPSFAPTLILGGLCALASLVTVVSGLANLLLFFKNAS